MKIAFSPSDILLPKNVDMTKWSTVACDQYTSEPEYWKRVINFVGSSPSTLNMVFPEFYLEAGKGEERIKSINKTMVEYYENNLFQEYKASFIYVERTQRDGRIRHGLMGMVDLLEYDYNKGATSLIRATEGTVLDRIPPRVKVRKEAILESPHIMLLIDDPKKTVIEPLANEKEKFEKVYDFSLMENSGHLKGYLVDNTNSENILNALSGLLEENSYKERYGSIGNGKLLFAVGDGNHSLATAKECYIQLKAKLTEEQWLNHPSRYALVEVVNVHDNSLEFEPIYRVVFGVEPKHLLEEMGKFYEISFNKEEGQVISYVTNEESGYITIKNPSNNLAVGSLQNFLDHYLKEFGGKVDYIHGEQVVNELGKKPNNIGFLLPTMAKEDLFKTVLIDGALPRKTFSMGHAWDKRFYTECRKIK